MNRHPSPWILASLVLAACSNGKDAYPTVRCDDVTATTCVEIPPGDPAALLDAVNSLTDDTVIVLAASVYELDNQVTVRNADGVQLVGQGMDETILDFAGSTAQTNGVDVVGDGFVVQDLTVRDAKKDGIRVEDSDQVTFRRIKATWSGGALSTNGSYGIYPVKSSNVLVEDSVAEFASDAGLYVGQCQHVIVRRNVVHDNVAGLEIENTQFADVYENEAYDNTGGIVVFDLPGNPIVGRDVRFYDNHIHNNNHENFAPGGTVAQIPPGTGTFALASRRVEITNNTYENNQTLDIALLNGLVIESDPMQWAISKTAIVGDMTGLAATDVDQDVDNYYNFRSTNIVVSGNSHSGGGTNPNGGDGLAPDLGALMFWLYGANDTDVDNVLYDGLGESLFDASGDDTTNSNDNLICVGGNTNGTYATLDIETLAMVAGSTFPPAIDPSMIYRPTAPFAPFDCTTLTGDPITPVSLPQLP